jgi:hypothetical protein
MVGLGNETFEVTRLKALRELHVNLITVFGAPTKINNVAFLELSEFNDMVWFRT